MNCPVCQSSEYLLFDQDKRRSYFQCHDCNLVYVPREQLVTPHEELERYNAHQNDEADTYYRNYLNDTKEASLKFLNKNHKGLDFGCGRTKLLGQLYKEDGFEVDSFDLYFFPDQSIWDKKYDFIILSEVIEHLANPWETMSALNHILKEKGVFFIKTKFYPPSKEDFSKWFYKRDSTHVEFFNDQSMDVLAKKLGKSFKQIGNDLYLLFDHRV